MHLRIHNNIYLKLKEHSQDLLFINSQCLFNVIILFQERCICLRNILKGEASKKMIVFAENLFTSVKNLNNRSIIIIK